MCMCIKTRNKFIEIRYCVSYGLVRSINSIPLFTKRNFYEMPFVVCFRIDKWTKSMLSITSSQQRSIIQLFLL